MIGEALRLIRVFHDVKLTAMAESLDVAVSYLSEVENGKRKPNLELVDKYARHFKIRPSAILFFAEEIGMETLSDRLKSSVRNKMLMLMKAIEKYGLVESNEV